jgi:uncharacterized protein (DUF2252 family)
MESPVPAADDSFLTSDDHRAAGKALRGQIPRSVHAAWEPPADRRDPIAILQAQDATRIPALVPERRKRMRQDPFAFLRGAAAIMAADLGAKPHSGLMVQACGDAHFMNFGAFASPEGTPVFDVNDFDETLRAPFEWDVKRLAASLAVSARVRKMPDGQAQALARDGVRAYRLAMLKHAALPPLGSWRSRIDLEAALGDIGTASVRKRALADLKRIVAATYDPGGELVGRGKLKLPHDPPRVWRLSAHEATAHEAFAEYVATQPEERRVLLLRYRLRDVAFKAVGVGSVGTFCAIGLFSDPDGAPLLLQLKEAQESVLAPYAGTSTSAHHGERVVVGQRIMQATPDVFLCAAEGKERSFYVRRLKDARLARLGEHVDDAALPTAGALCGRTLARAHARSGNPARIAGYLGSGTAFEDALASFALAYAAQTDADHAELEAAIRSGRLEAAS